MISEIILSQDRFFEEKLTGLKRKNFIYGKNGTGKSSITEMIAEQYSNDKDIFIFQGFKSVIAENGNLNAISLGDVNSKLQPEIEKQQEIIDTLSRDLEEPKIECENSYTRFKKAEKEYEEFSKSMEKFYITAASSIKNEHSEWTGINYNKNHFKNDIKDAITLSKDQVLEYKSKEAQTTITNIIKPSFIEPKVEKFLESVNKIITTNITKSAVLNFETNNEMNWVKEGLYFHEEGDRCAFCGSTVSKIRYDDLNSFFNNEIKILEEKINNGIRQIEKSKEEINEITIIDKHNYFRKFHFQLDKLNAKILDLKDRHNAYFDLLIQTLKKKKEDIFLPLNEIGIAYPPDFKEIIKESNELYNENLRYNENLEDIKKEAQQKLKLNEVSTKLIDNDYDKNMKRFEKLKFEKLEAERLINEQNAKLLNEKNKLEELLSQTVDESKAALNINNLLERLGNQSFKLVSVKKDKQKGQYNIRGYDDKIRNIETLSTGEKNIVAFLWFIFNLENTELKASNDAIIIFDDPMNSNDDTAQYLIISKLQELIKNIGDRQLFIFTHNIHFYINARFRWWNGCNKESYDKATFHLLKNGVKTHVNYIFKEEDDLRTSYDALWSEVKWLYKNNKPDMMINPLRRIFETYQKFNKINDIYLNDAEARKLFNVNSHSIDDLEADLNGKNKVELMFKVEEIFTDIGAREHFNHYW
jgi:wobble nucleotide-excising tRNase